MFKKIALIILLIFCAILPYIGNVFDNFVSDDWDFLQIARSNERPLVDYFSTNYYGDNEGGSYRPMVNVFWISFYKFFGLNSLPYHLATLIFHTGNVILIYFIVKLFFKREVEEKKLIIMSFLAAMFFAFLPNHSEAVVWISTINDTMMLFFFLLSWLFYLLAFDDYFKPRLIYYLFSLISLGISIFTKEMALTLPIILVFILVYKLFKNENLRKRWLNQVFFLLPYFLIILIYFLLRASFTGFLFSYYGSGLSFSWNYLLRSVATIFISNFFSDGLRNNISLFVLGQGMYFLLSILIVLFLLLYLFYKKIFSGLLLFFVLFLTSIIPVYQFGVQASSLYFSEEGERFAYLPSVFLTIFLSYLLVSLFYLVKIRKNSYYLLIFFSLFFLSSFVFQLRVKNLRWHQASLVVDKIIEETRLELDKNKITGAILVGVPDHYHGAYIFRNGLESALNMSGFDGIDFLVSESHIWYNGQADFSAHRLNDSDFLYEENNQILAINSRPFLNSYDYSSRLVEPKIEHTALGDITVSSKFELKLSKNFLKDNFEGEVNKRIGIWFYNKNWLTFDLYD